MAEIVSLAEAVAAEPEIIAGPSPAELDALRTFTHGTPGVGQDR